MRELLLKWRCESRYVLERKIFPKIKKKRVLLVGVAHYTEDYPWRLRKNDLHSIDIDPAVAEYGSKKHLIGNIVKANKYFPEDFFDIIIFFGVFGYGLDKQKDAEGAMKSCNKILKPGGLLIIGWGNIPGHNQINPRKLKNFNLFNTISLFKIPSSYKTRNKGVFEFLIKKEKLNMQICEEES